MKYKKGDIIKVIANLGSGCKPGEKAVILALIDDEEDGGVLYNLMDGNIEIRDSWFANFSEIEPIFTQNPIIKNILEKYEKI